MISRGQRVIMEYESGVLVYCSISVSLSMSLERPHWFCYYIVDRSVVKCTFSYFLSRNSSCQGAPCRTSMRKEVPYDRLMFQWWTTDGRNGCLLNSTRSLLDQSSLRLREHVTCVRSRHTCTRATEHGEYFRQHCSSAHVLQDWLARVARC
jgi:hypothetical protein